MTGEAGALLLDLVLQPVQGREGADQDPVQELSGRPLVAWLEPFLWHPPQELGRGRGQVLSLVLAQDEGASIPMGLLGSVGLHHDRGYVVLTMPPVWAHWVVQQLGRTIVHGPVPSPWARGLAFWVRPGPDRPLVLSLPGLGTLRLEHRETG